MVIIAAAHKSEDWSRLETYYQTDYKKWNGLVSDIPVMRQIIEIRAASVFSEWTVRGTHSKAAERLLNQMKGRGCETFKQIMANLYKVAYICGDSYAEKIYDDDDNLIDLEILPADNIRQVVRKGKIVRFEEIDGDAKWEPYQIFHVRYMPRGAMTHGVGMIEGLNNILLSYKQMLQLGQEMYERMTRPMKIIFSKTADATKNQQIWDAIKAGGEEWHGYIVLPGSLIDTDIKEFVLNPSMKPQEWLESLSDQIYKATATSEIILGQGYANSEESIAGHLAGFHGSIRYDQETFEDDVRKQLFEEMWENAPDIEFSWTAEDEPEKFLRYRDTIPVIEASVTTAPENKSELLKECYDKMGLIE